jgi:predicted deacetylase
MPAEYLIRLDDACPTMDGVRWASLEEMLDRHGVRPIVAIVPENADPDLIRGSADAGFWARAKMWASRGWSIALHGHRHQLRRVRGSLVSSSHYAEFTGLPWAEQRHRIREGIRIMVGQGLRPEIWVAPAHGFDLATLQALREESTIRTISDGFACRPFVHLGFTWLPQQLWHSREMSFGLWTICLHPNDMDDAAVARLEKLIETHPGSFPEAREAALRAVDYRSSDRIFGFTFRTALRIKNMLSGRKT